MSDELDENIDSTNDTVDDAQADEGQGAADIDTNGQQDDTSANDGDSEVEKLKKQNQKLFERAKKAEGFEKQPDGSWVKVLKKPEAKVETQVETKPSDKKDGLTPMDAITLSKANITEKEDIDELLAYASFRNISINDALKDETMQTILRNKAEQRQTAQATNTGGGRRGSSKSTAQQILNDVAAGNLPEDPADFADAYWESKKK